MHAFVETIAITIWNDIISPLFDASCQLLIVRPDERRELQNVRQMTNIEKAETIKKKGAIYLICGAISNEASSILSERDIKVFSWISGPVENIIDSFKRHENIRELYAMPGYTSRSRMCRHRKQKGRFCRIK